MSISLNSDVTAIAQQLSTQNAKSSKASELSSKLSNLDGASDEELLEACRSFESYLIEQVMGKVKDAMVPESEDDENEYMKMFGDELYKSYAETISQSGQLGIAQQLYEAMRRDYGVKIVNVATDTE